MGSATSTVDNSSCSPVRIDDFMELEAEANKLTVDTGPMLCAGNELAEAASQSLEMELKFEDVSE